MQKIIQRRGLHTAVMNHVIKPVAFVESVYREKTGTPRQPFLVPKAKGIIKLETSHFTESFFSHQTEQQKQGFQVEHCIDGLEGFSHLLLIFLFHQNNSNHVDAKVRPPRLDGDKIGVFACRSPYRFNNLGITTVKLDKIEKTNSQIVQLHISGLDLVDGTPIFDIKPYIPEYDSIPNATTASWFQNTPIDFKQQIGTIIWTKEAFEQLQTLISRSKFYTDVKELQQCMEEVLQLDPRSKYRREKCEHEIFGFLFDNFNVRCVIKDDEACIVEVEDWSTLTQKPSNEELKKKNRADLEKYKDVFSAKDS